MSAQPSLFGPSEWVEPVGVTGDPHDAFYTPDPLADAIVATMDGYVVYAPSDFDEPCSGGGSIIRSVRARWPKVRVWGCDSDPRATGLALCDEAVLGDCRDALPGRAHIRRRLLITNTPFSTEQEDDRDRSFGCVRACVESNRGGWTGLIIPAGWVLGGSRFAWFRSPEWCPEVVHPIPGRFWPKNVREVTLCVWPPSHLHPHSMRIGDDIIVGGALE